MFKNDFGEYCKGNNPNFEHNWSTTLDRLEDATSSRVKTIFDSKECPRCGYRLK